MNGIIKKIIFLTATFYLIVLSSLFCVCAQSELINIKIKDINIQAEVARDAFSRSIGLKFRQELPKDQGMLFVFDTPGIYGFYMKDTLIDLDIAFIDKDHSIIQISSLSKGVEKSIYPKKDILYSLEMNKGFFEANQIHDGDKVEILSFNKGRFYGEK